MYGNGCPGPTASGVSTGKIWRTKTRSSSSRSSSPRRRPCRRRFPRRRAPGQSSSRQSPSARRSARARASRISSSVCCGVRPSGERTCAPGDDLLEQARDADHEELVEVRREDPAELDALEQRLVRVGRELEHARCSGRAARAPGSGTASAAVRGRALLWPPWVAKHLRLGVNGGCRFGDRPGLSDRIRILSAE